MLSSVWQFLRDKNANTTVIVALAAVPMLGVAGVAVDMARSNNARSTISAALDSAVLAGASADKNHLKSAEDYFNGNLHLDDVIITNRVFKKTGDIIVHGEIHGKFKTSFTTFLGLPELQLRIEAEAQRLPDTTAPCILALSPTGTNAFLVNGGANVEGSECSVHVKSTGNPSAIFNAGTEINTDKLCLQGKDIIDNGGLHPNLEKQCQTAADPFAGKIPEPAAASCISDQSYNSNVTLNPGTYCGWHNFNGGVNVVLNPGLYVIKSGGWNANGGDWQGNGVTFYFADTAKIQFNSSVKAKLTAPTSGVYKDIVMAEKEGLAKTQFIFDDNRGFDMTGVVYLPSRELVFNGGSTTHSRKMMTIADKIILNQTNWKIEPFGDAGSAGKMAVLTK